MKGARRARLLLALCGVLTACGTSGGSEAPPTPVPTPTPPPQAPSAVVVAAARTTGTYGYFRFLGNWRHVSGKHDGRIDGASSMSTRIGDRATLRFYGSGVRVYGVAGRSGGYGDVRLDGHEAGIRNFYRPVVEARELVFSAHDLPRGEPHEVQITVTGLHNPASHMDYVNLSGAVIQP